MSSSTKVGVIAALAFLLPVLLIAGAAEGVAALFGGGTSLTTCTTTGGTGGHGGGAYQPDQIANATTIVAVGKQMNVPQQGWVVAIAAALQESDLVNVDHGDRDSLGLFQERPSQGWGTPAQVMDPTYAATQFYRHLLAVPGWQQMSVNDDAQAVERSGFPQAYGPHEQAARQIVGAVAGTECTTGSGSPTTSGSSSCQTIQTPNPIALAAITYACSQIGLPYQWGGNGPANGDSGFDCSGLTTAAYAAAGIPLPRTAQTQYNAGPLLPSGAPLQLGDLVFYGTPSQVHHVAIYIGQGKMIHAPTFGQPVQIASLNLMADFVGASRPAGDSRAFVLSAAR